MRCDAGSVFVLTLFVPLFVFVLAGLVCVGCFSNLVPG
jgi:hypothetical protein